MTASSPRLLLFTKGEDLNPATRYRFLQYRPYLEDAGFEISIRPLFPNAWYGLSELDSRFKMIASKSLISGYSFLRRFGKLHLARKADLVVVENQLFPYEQGLLEALLFKMGAKTIFEFDDAIYQTPFHRRKLLRVLRKANHVIVGNDYLAGFARWANSRVSVIPTVIDMNRYPEPPMTEAQSKGKPFRIGWIGLPGTLKYLRRIHEPLRRLAAEGPLELWVISSVSLDMPGVKLRHVEWSEATEVDTLSRLDAGVMPLPDDEWTRGKCGLKLLQYMAAGRASVASPVGVNSRIIADGRNGFLAANDEDWHRKLKELRENAVLRRRIGAEARLTVAKYYSLEEWGPKVAGLYRSVLDGAT